MNRKIERKLPKNLLFGFRNNFADFLAWTGKYLRSVYPQKEDLEICFRVMIRSRHIFLLLIGLIEVGIGVYIRQSRKSFFFGIQFLATFFIICAHVLFVYGFFYEIAVETIPATPLIHWATYLLLGAIGLHLLTIVERNKENN